MGGNAEVEAGNAVLDDAFQELATGTAGRREDDDFEAARERQRGHKDGDAADMAPPITHTASVFLWYAPSRMRGGT